MLQARISDKQVQSILKLNPIDRYEHAIKQIVGWGKLWSLYNEGWGLVGDNEKRYLPIWPAKEYAKICVVDEWKNYHPKSIELDDFLTKIVPDLIKNDIFLAVFVTPQDQGVTPSYEEFISHISQELDKY